MGMMGLRLLRRFATGSRTKAPGTVQNIACCLFGFDYKSGLLLRKRIQ